MREHGKKGENKKVVLVVGGKEGEGTRGLDKRGTEEEERVNERAWRDREE